MARRKSSRRPAANRRDPSTGRFTSRKPPPPATTDDSARKTSEESRALAAASSPPVRRRGPAESALSEHAFETPSPPRSNWNDLGWLYAAATLVGLAAGWQWLGTRATMSAVLDPSSATVTMVAAIALLAASVGPRVPAHLALRIALYLKRRAGRAVTIPSEMDTIPWILPLDRQKDEPLLWLSLSVLSSIAGALALMVLPLAGLWAHIHGFMMERFFWTGFMLTGWEWAGAASVIGATWIANGLVTTALAPLASGRTDAPWDVPRIAVGVLAGLGLAWGTDHWLGLYLSATQQLLLGVLPMFGLSIMAAVRSQRVQQRPLGTAEPQLSVPEITGRAEEWVWLSLVVWGAATLMAIAGWLNCQDTPNAASGSAGMGRGALGVCVLSIAAGVAVAAIHTRKRRKSASGCGMAMWAAGIGTGIATLLIGQAPGIPPLLGCAVIGAPAGYALHYAERAWLARADSESHGFARMVTALPAGGAIGLIVAEYLVLPSLGPMGMIALGALLMLGLGGLVQIFEREPPTHTQYLRLALVFGSLSAAIIVFPISVQRWDSRPLADEPRRLSILPSSPGQLLHTRRICLLGLGSRTTVEGLAGFDGQVDVLSLEPTGPRRSNVADTTHIHFPAGSAFRVLRQDRRRYDLIYQRGPELRPSLSRAAYTLEWFSMLAARTTAGGHVIVDIPVAGVDREAIRLISTTFERAAGAPTVWRIIRSEAPPILRLRARPGSPPFSPGEPEGEWSPAAVLLTGDPARYRPHSLTRDRLGRLLAPSTAESGDRVTAWLESLR